MPPRRVVKGRPSRKNVEPQEQGVPNAQNVKPQGDVTNVEFREAIRILSQVVTNQSTFEYPENFIEELKKVFEVMHVADTEWVEIAAYQLKGVSRTWFDQLKKGRNEDAAHLSLDYFEEALLRHFFPRELNKAKGPIPSSSSVIAPRNKGQHHGQNSQTFKARPTQSQVAPPDKDAPRGSTSSIGGGPNRLDGITSRKDQENSPNVVTSMIKVFDFDIYALIDPGAGLYFVTPYIANKFDIILEKLCAPFWVSTPIEKSILAERVYPDCVISIDQKHTLADLIELDMVDFDVILGMD
ncbi:uncharacterized protein LOC107025074 [Solanum pennellii]|uniref:Uncharacterized protein LOC107025074 n=1 Tax=Solanum pennellii TaxID=28526 RepID=A0ABM1H7C7_SOLPN|nr:uncharacterized protein LOC107025074 [Solanum pennellii]